ncbi:MAG: 1-acylglycerol-3-phosphate O-acyltransferase [Flavobacteriales bacterium]|nr:1-acylglycerol-3-phosphate O-acyltransferase [Flavobacteriales bacterium]MCX7767511.1 1-acylglycerol-3-phosphate O-acyltransferase [Flavobacteriales bacterium]MDW8409646.1 1-acylglycerol-3-phosphate O-acyltransferase [Flavobacteriales bacterium]
MRTFLVKAWRLYFLLNFLITLLFFYWIFRILLPRPRYHALAHRLQVLWATWLLRTTGIRWRIYGQENLPAQGGYIVVANHSSALDILLMYKCIPRPFHFIAKIEHARTPLFGVMFGHTHIPLNRASAIQSAKALERAAADLARGIPIVIFPEGTMNKSGKGLLPFKEGAFHLAMKMGVPVVPVAFPDHPRLLPRIYELFYPKGGPGLSRIYIGPPLLPKGGIHTGKELKEAARAFIEKCISESKPDGL